MNPICLSLQAIIIRAFFDDIHFPMDVIRDIS